MFGIGTKLGSSQILVRRWLVEQVDLCIRFLAMGLLVELLALLALAAVRLLITFSLSNTASIAIAICRCCSLRFAFAPSGSLLHSPANSFA
jgi:hypothetical protein